MHAVRYVCGNYPTLCKWMDQHNCRIQPEDEVPQVGYVVYDDEGEPAAMAFLRMVEGGFAQLDGLITNPEKAPAVRNSAVDLAVSNIVTEAKRMKLKRLIAFSADANTLVRSERHGFAKLLHTAIIKDL